MANGLNDWNVSYAAIRFVEGALSSYGKISDFTRRNDIVFEIERVDGMPDTTVVLVNRYTFGLADVLRVKSEFPETDCIVTCTNWNHYTNEAKQ